MRQAETFLLSSRYEGLPTVLIEALACGCPIVATDCVSGPREILADGEFGRLAPTEDHAELAAAVMETLADPIPPAKLRERAADFAPEAVFDEYERFIRAYVSST
jgi:glycosyltransferase involved in cell wall biosynthesis